MKQTKNHHLPNGYETKDEYSINGSQISKYLFVILFFGLIPFVSIFSLLSLHPYMKIFTIIADLTNDWPGMSSAHNPLMSKIMDVYLKFYPIFSLISIILTFKYTTPKHNPHIFKSVLASLFIIALTTLTTYYQSYLNHELTEEFLFKRLISHSDFFMMLYFMLSFSGLFLIGSLSIIGLIGTLRGVLKGRG